ncbi:MAG: inorganic pyrophosphatase [Clostridia bacterium]|nr:inorganic pyrophosphatase [Clostridia bacterium]
MLGKIVKVTVDRPLGSYHPSHKDLYYPVNYGFVKGIIAGDGEYQDAYVLGVYEPKKEYTGKVIAIIHRLDDVEDKWIVAPTEMTFTTEEIYKQVEFQEKYFEIEIQM